MTDPDMTELAAMSEDEINAELALLGYTAEELDAFKVRTAALIRACTELRATRRRIAHALSDEGVSEAVLVLIESLAPHYAVPPTGFILDAGMRAAILDAGMRAAIRAALGEP